MPALDLLYSYCKSNKYGLPGHFVVRRFYNDVKAFASFAEGYEL